MERDNMYKKILLICGLLLFPSIIFADSITIKCPDSIELNKEFVCSLNGNSVLGVTGIDMKLSVSSSVELLSVVVDSNNWQGDGEKGDIKLFTADTFKDDFKICDVKLRMKEVSGTLLLSSIILYDDNVKPVQIPAISKQIKASEVVTTTTKKVENTTTKKANSEAEVTTTKENEKPTQKNDNTSEEPVISSKYLVDIQIKNYELEFYKDVFEYTLIIGSEKKLQITPTLEDSTAKYQIIGNNNLKDGSAITIKVTSANNESQEYVINIETQKEKKDYKWLFIAIISGVIIINIIRIIRSKVKKK